MNAMKRRDTAIDIAKGIGIILVVFGHTFQIYSVTSYVYAFHMPCFFLLSGYTFNIQKYLRDPARFLKRNFLRLMVPYFGAAIFSYILYVYLSPILSLPEITASAATLGILNGNGINLPFNNVLWFLPAFFFAGLIFLALGFMFKGIRLLIGVILVSVSGIIIGLSYHLPFGFDIAMTTQFFIYCGHVFREADLLEKTKRSLNRGFLTCIAFLAMLVMFVFSSVNGRVDLMTRVYGQPAIFFVAGLSGSVSVLMVSLFLSIEGLQYNYFGKIWQIIGKASMFTFISHIPIFYCVASACALLWGFWIYYTFVSYWYLLFIIGVSVPTLIYVLVTFTRNKKNR